MLGGKACLHAWWAAATCGALHPAGNSGRGKIFVMTPTMTCVHAKRPSAHHAITTIR